ncbi:MAG: 2-succinyl-5-enolpyruvyl-6-hydroxy-3-cyclohexene-1-carboxylic-acid synthase [Cyanobacteria bacterium J06642_2]
MPLDFRNCNTLWASVLVETLRRLGLKTVVITPGSRSTPLVFTFTSTSDIECISLLDERSASFFALGMAKRTGCPIAIACTSGTAGANMYPAAIEARESRVPLLILTADRPPELHDCSSGQTIRQTQLFGNYPNWQTTLAEPSDSEAMLRYLRQTTIQAWERALTPVPGPVHLNIPFRDPLVPQPNPAILARQDHLVATDFFAGVRARMPTTYATNISLPLTTWQHCDRGLIVAGPAFPSHSESYCQAVAQLSICLGWPVLAAGLSPLRNFVDLNSHVVAHYDLILRDRDLAAHLQPDIVVQLGPLPTSKVLRQWLEELQPLTWVVDAGDRNLDPLHSRTEKLQMTVEQLAARMQIENSTLPSSQSKLWFEAETHVREVVMATMMSCDRLLESKVAWMLSQYLPEDTLLFVANSTPVRDLEWFWVTVRSRVRPYCNRGANGIDGTLSSALGMAHGDRSSVLLTGDLALLHDTNGFLGAGRLQGHLTVVLVNNCGGGIFNLLPVANYDPPFEEFFATPQQVDIARLCAAYGVEWELVETWESFARSLNPLPASGVRVLEIRCDRHADSRWRIEHLDRFIADFPLSTGE